MSLPSTEAIDVVFAEVKELLELSDKEWKLIGTENDATVYTRKYKNFSQRLVKITAVIKHPVEQVKDGLFVIENRTKWDTMVKTANEIKKVGEVQVFHIETPQIAIISPRDCVAYNVIREDGAGGYLTVTQSLEGSEKEIPLKKDVIRVVIILSGSKLEATTVEGAPATKITIISISDPKGMIPKINLKPLLMKGTTTIQSLRDFISKQQSKS